jgi:hypothetical protein
MEMGKSRTEMTLKELEKAYAYVKARWVIKDRRHLIKQHSKPVIINNRPMQKMSMWWDMPEKRV